uniref:Uncharacterized protein n=1 Tax=viral metagenome TaxID=1070528 RepID=A0A6C0DIY4_9ZZZZ
MDKKMSKIENPKYFLDHFSAIKIMLTENFEKSWYSI